MSRAGLFKKKASPQGSTLIQGTAALGGFLVHRTGRESLGQEGTYPVQRLARGTSIGNSGAAEALCQIGIDHQIYWHIGSFQGRGEFLGLFGRNPVISPAMLDQEGRACGR